MDLRQNTSPCGIDCFNCELFGDNITREMQERIAQYKNQPAETIRCLGCRESGCLIIHGECRTKTCVEEKGVEFCFECDEFPCTYLQPCCDGAETFPQNYKLFNLCRMKKLGVEKWAAEEALKIRRLYKDGKLQIGGGPVLPD
ncbi:MAG: DUF3795 domain-containing protein [Candidatus Omnitrophica bacterium]|nr:DUF3795 domain-containing protein [Candidatus Omnitrophota bacterium]